VKKTKQGIDKGRKGVNPRRRRKKTMDLIRE